jgi:hypothetical protein
MRRPASLLLAVILLSCLSCRTRVEPSPDDGQAVWFVHATDPHLFYDDEKDKSVRLHQQKLNQSAFSDLIRGLGAVPGLESRPSFLLVTGDLGLDRFGRVTPPPASTAPPVVKAPDQTVEEPVTPAERESAVTLLAETLKASPVKDIYLVLGNNDVAHESATGADLETAAAFLADVQKRIAPSGVILHDLSSCYRDKAHLPSGCAFDVPGTNFRLLGFSSYSFKNGGASYAANQAEQEAEIQQLATMVHQADAQGKKVLIVTHIPEIDDPYPLGQLRFRGTSPEKSQRPEWAKFSPWNVSPAVYQAWKDVVDSSAVAGVLAGHFHDSHKELYYRPYGWATSPRERADLRKLFLAPPLAARFQDTSPIQARGFALFRLAGDQVTRKFYWLNPGSSSFLPDPGPVRPARPESSAARVAGWLWSVGNDKGDLARAAIIAIAFLAALLTVIATWEIPPPETRPSSASRPKAEPADPTSQSRPAAGTSSLIAPFQGNFAKTVLSGLGGMAVISLVDDAFWKEAGISPKAQFLVLFVAFFLAVLLSSALYQGVVEALRSRVVLVHRPPQWAPRRRKNGTAPQHVLYWGRRAWSWLLSWRQAVLIFLDTVFNVVQGRNQLRTAGFAKAVQNLHWAQYRVAGRVREAIDKAILNALNKEDAQRILAEMGVEPPREDSDIRVNVGLLSEDGASVSYFSWERGSLGKPFDQHSVAWVSIASGKALWIKEGKRQGVDWEKVYSDDTTLLKNEYGELPVKAPLRLKDYYQRRDPPDYEAFVVLPVPWSRRGELGEYQKAGVLISFRRAAYMHALWDGLEASGKPNFGAWTGLLECSRERPVRQAARHLEGGLVENLVALAERVIEGEETVPVPAAKTAGDEGKVLIRDPELQAVLHQGIEVLGEALRYFSPTYFEEQILPYIQS